ncbi:hypothetical protein CJA_1509 [Cellvibrio japonicus Ueda107]|uniref:Uncharacterized protein n=1 Tax=Cellvibrio japonicus (strain Ueda107) TaxID=498211 RepID=B3PDQ0_CELJU|nr:hypothetical protein CJA_1509 [Cellvibrio japonicus Ueda107]
MIKQMETLKNQPAFRCDRHANKKGDPEIAFFNRNLTSGITSQ